MNADKDAAPPNIKYDIINFMVVKINSYVI